MSDLSVAKLTTYAAHVGEYLQRLPLDKCRQALMVFIVFLIVTLLGNNFWFFFPAQDNAIPTIGRSGLNQGSVMEKGKNTIDYDKIGTWQLFGEEPSTTKEDSEKLQQPVNDDIDENVRETHLNLRLVGIIHASDPKEGYAIMLYSGETGLIKVGQAIPVGNDISLAKVLVDKVIINNKGNFESLTLFDSETKLPVKKNVKRVKSPRSKVLDKRNDRKVTQLMREYRTKLINDPMSMANVIRVSLATDASGEVIGYRIRPGRHRKQFAELGLKSGDIVTAINGVSLSDQQNAMQLYSNLSSLSEASFDIKRGDSEISIMVNLSN